MRIDKVIVRAFLNTIYAIGILFAFMILTLVCVYPSTLMRMTYDLGMDSVSIVFAKSAYNRTDEVYYIAYATEVAIGLNSDEKIAACGERFIADEQFDAYCTEKNKQLPEGVQGTYEQYVYGKVCVAEYNLGEKGSALEKAFGSIGEGFPRNNAVAALLVTSLRADDTETVAKIKEKMDEMPIEGMSEDDATFFEEILVLFGKE